jgi:hypothetical protein
LTSAASAPVGRRAKRVSPVARGHSWASATDMVGLGFLPRAPSPRAGKV